MSLPLIIKIEKSREWAASITSVIELVQRPKEVRKILLATNLEVETTG
jgi:hypothetical protein